ncbi:MAG: ATP-grasp domain-containing protein [Verrucomicrobia bacterium]|nr:ATP-grasp domain-containing protein [Verrucomicrobiota bacterium]
MRQDPAYDILPQNRPCVVLFSSAGRRVELMNCFRADARGLGISIKVLATDLNPAYSPACQFADEAIPMPRCTDAEFIPRMLDVCVRKGASLIIPTIDTELPILAAHRSEFAHCGVRIAISSPSVVNLARDKRATAQFLQSHGLPVPRTGSIDDVIADAGSWSWPLILKPVDGSCSKGLHVISDVAALMALPVSRLNYVAQELWKGKEYTVNIFFDDTGRLRCAVPHWRYETRAGEVSKGITVREPTLMKLAERLGEKLEGARGAMCFQAIVRPDGAAAIFEINARFGGGYPLTHAAGARFSQWLLEESLGRPSTASNQWQENLKLLRYDAAVFVGKEREP